MDFEYTPEQEALRKELRGWLAANLPPDLCVDDPADDRVAPDRATFERRCAWQKTMHKAGWVGIAWPQAYGGRGASIIERVIWDEEYSASHAPVLPGMGLNLVGPTIIHWGSDAQKARYLPRILSADEIWAQGFSEPGAGSDLASLRTRAEDKGDHFLVNGQKVWTSGAQYADSIILLVRTDPSVPKHNGISCLLVDMRAPGVSVRPLVLATGHHHFNEVFFTDVMVPKSQLLGPLNAGWKVSTTTLMYERHSSGARNPVGQVRDLRRHQRDPAQHHRRARPGAAEGLRRRGRDPGPAPAAAQATTSVAVALVAVIVLVVAVTGLVVLVIAPGAAGPVGDTGARADVLAVDEGVVDDGQPDAVRILGRRHLGALVIENGDADDLA